MPRSLPRKFLMVDKTNVSVDRRCERVYTWELFDGLTNICKGLQKMRESLRAEFLMVYKIFAKVYKRFTRVCRSVSDGLLKTCNGLQKMRENLQGDFLMVYKRIVRVYKRFAMVYKRNSEWFTQDPGCKRQRIRRCKRQRIR